MREPLYRAHVGRQPDRAWRTLARPPSGGGGDRRLRCAVRSGSLLGASWWNETLLAALVTVGLSFLVGWRVGFPATVVALVALAFGSTAGDLSGSVVSMWVFTIPAWVIGQVMRSRSHLSAQLAERARELEEERKGFAREVVRYERARIARDLHDIVAHNLSLIVVQAGAGRRASREHPEVLSESLRHIEAGARSAREEIDTRRPAR